MAHLRAQYRNIAPKLDIMRFRLYWGLRNDDRFRWRDAAIGFECPAVETRDVRPERQRQPVINKNRLLPVRLVAIHFQIERPSGTHLRGGPVQDANLKPFTGSILDNIRRERIKRIDFVPVLDPIPLRNMRVGVRGGFRHSQVIVL